jgi:molybdenum cofactor cytidylyltransferase
MIALERTVAVLLCAGRSERFGEDDKLLHPLGGKPLVAYAADRLAALPFMASVATVRPDAPNLHSLLAAKGFAVRQTGPEATQAQSLRCGLESALALSPDAILLALGDMPWVTTEHLFALARAADMTCPAASGGDDWISPPWIAPAEWVSANLEALKSALNRDAIAIPASENILRDVDRLEDFYRN